MPREESKGAWKLERNLEEFCVEQATARMWDK